MSTPAEEPNCPRCLRRDRFLHATLTEDGGVCDGCLTLAEQEGAFVAGQAAPPPWIEADQEWPR